MINCLQFCFNFAFKFNLRRYNMIESPRYPGDTFTVAVYANTNGNSLSTWSVQLQWSTR